MLLADLAQVEAESRCAAPGLNGAQKVCAVGKGGALAKLSSDYNKFKEQNAGIDPTLEARVRQALGMAGGGA